MLLRPAVTNFTAGEISPKMLGRFDFPKYQNGCERLENFFVWPQGMASFRPGTRFIGEVKTSSKATRLIPFEFSTEQTYIIEAGDQYFRFYMDQGQILDNGSPYEISTPYLEADLFDLRFVQSADVLYIACKKYPPYKLSRTGHTSWALEKIDFQDGPYLSQNTKDITIEPSGIKGSITLTALPTKGEEMVKNRKFLAVLGPEKVSNGHFGSDSDWVWGDYWTWDSENERATSSPGISDLEQNIDAVATEKYLLTFEIESRTEGYVDVQIGGSSWQTCVYNQKYKLYFTAADTGNLIIRSDVSFNGSVKDVSVKKMSADTDWTWGANWVHNLETEEAVHTAGDTEALEQDVSAEAEKTYRVKVTVKGRTAGSITPQIGGVNGTAITSNGRFIQQITTTGTGNLKFVPTTDFNGRLDDTGVKEVDLVTEIFKSGHVGSQWRLCLENVWGYVEITVVTDRITATATVKSADLSEEGRLEAAVPTEDWREGAWSEVRGYPGQVVFHENRLIWAASLYQPQTFWASKSGDYENHVPGEDDADPLVFTINADHVNPIVWMVSQDALMTGTGRGQFRVSASTANDALTPSNIKAPPQTSLTSAPVACKCDHTVLFWQAFGRRLMEMAYSLETDSYTANNLSVLSDHMGKPAVREMVYLQEPLGIAIGVREDGQLIMVTYERAHEVVAWTRQVTDGLFESVANIAGATRDEIWMVVKRTIDGATKRYIELLHDFEAFEDTKEDLFYVDSGLTYSGVPTSTITGLGHLEKKTVAVLGDGNVQISKVVSGGSISLDTAVSKAQIGLPFTGYLAPVRVEASLKEGTLQGRIKRVAGMALRLYRSWGGKIGASTAKLENLALTGNTDLFTDDLILPFPGDYDRSGKMVLVQDKPLPMNVLSIMPVMTSE